MRIVLKQRFQGAMSEQFKITILRYALAEDVVKVFDVRNAAISESTLKFLLVTNKSHNSF